MTTYSPYQNRIRECFAASYRFIEKYAPVRTDEAWYDIVESLGQYDSDPLTVDLIVACVSELEREYLEHKKSISQPPCEICHD